MGLDLCKPVWNGFHLAPDSDSNPDPAADRCGRFADRCCDWCCQACVEVCCGLCSRDCGYTFCSICLGVTQSLRSGNPSGKPPPASSVKGYDESKAPWRDAPKAEAQEVVDTQTKVVRHQ